MSTLAVLGLLTVLAVVLIVGGSAWLFLRDSYRAAQEARAKRAARQEEPAPRHNRHAPQRTRLRPWSPEVVAVLLLAVAAGLWLAKLAG